MAYQYPVTLRTFHLDRSSNLYFEVNVPAIGYSSGPASAGAYPYLNDQGQLDPSFLPPIPQGLSLETNGTLNPLQTLLNLKSGSNITLITDAQGGVTISASGTVSISFDSLASGTNTTANMVMGSGASLTTTGTGIIESTELATTGNPVNVSNSTPPAHAGQLLISQPGNTTAVWADPLVQGLYPPGTNVSTAGGVSPPVPINPVLVGGEGTSLSGKDGLLHPLPLSSAGGSVLTLPNAQELLNQGYIDPYSRARVSNPVTLFEESFQFFPIGPLTGSPPSLQTPTQFTYLTTGSGAFNRPSSAANITGTVGTDSGARAVWQTKSYFIAQLGEGFVVMTAGNLGANVPNVITRMGAYDDDHGGFFEQNGTTGTLRVVFRTNGSDAMAFPQSAWNIDKMDGTGNSGITLNMAFGQVFVLDVGAGRIRFGLVVNGITYYCHAISVTNIVPSLVNSQSIVPVRFEILNVGTSTGGSVSQSNLVVFTDSGFEDNPSAFAYSVNTGTTLVTVTTPMPVLSIRPKLLLNGHPNRTFITLRDFGIFSSGQVALYQLIWNGTLTGANFQSVDSTSAVEYDTSASGITGGRVVDSGYIAAFNKDTTFGADTFPFRLPFTLDITGTIQDVYTLVISGVNSSSAMVGGSFKWQEER